MNLIFATIHAGPGTRAVPLASGMLASTARRMLGDIVSVALLDFSPDVSPEECVETILSGSPDCVAFSLYVWNRRLAVATASLLRTRSPSTVLTAGGPEADAGTVELERVFDVVIRGEGESLFADALLLLSEGAGLGTIRKAVDSPSPPDLSTLPSPWLDGTLDASKYPGVLWELSRGCPFSCHFCYESKGTRGVRTFPVERLKEELALFARSGVEEVFVLDPTFNCDRKRASALLSLMEETAPGLHYSIEVRSEFLDRKTARQFASLDCSLQIGLQSADERVLANVGRTIDREAFARSALLLDEWGVTYGFDLIYGLPGDSLDGFLASLDFALGMAPNHVDIFPLQVLPGTRLAETASGFGIVRLEEPPYAVLSSSDWSASDMAEASRVADAVDLFYNRGGAVPWFPLVLSNLGLKASDFFRRFAGMYEGRLSGETPGDRVRFQREFLSTLFEERGATGSARIAEDIVTLFAEEDGTVSGAAYTHDRDSLLSHLESGVEDFEELSFFVPRA